MSDDRIPLVALEQILQEPISETALLEDLLQAMQGWTEWESNRPGLGELPRVICSSLGGNARAALPVTLAWQLVRRSVKLLDDLQDGEEIASRPTALNVGVGLLLAAQLALTGKRIYAEPCRQGEFVASHLQTALLRAGAGQQADLLAVSPRSEIPTPEGWLEIARAKSGALLEWAAWSGAWVAGAEDRILIATQAFGNALGALLQVADDYEGLWGEKSPSVQEWNQLSLPLCYAFQVACPKERMDLHDSLSRMGRESTQSEEIQRFLVRMGAQAYTLAVGKLLVWECRTALAAMNLGPRTGSPLHDLVRQVFPAASMGA